MNHARLDGWRRMADTRWHFFCDRIAICARWAMPYRVGTAQRWHNVGTAQRWHNFPVCVDCAKKVLF